MGMSIKNNIVRLLTVLLVTVILFQLLVSKELTSLALSILDRNNIRVVEGEWVDFEYTGSEQSYTLQAGKLYEIETWGANGGDGGQGYESSVIKDSGGLGAFSSGFVFAEKATTLHIVVGGRGSDRYPTAGIAKGGFNGGGDAGERSGGVGGVQGGAGGGATHIATKSGLLKDLDNDKDSVVIVAAAGGGGVKSDRNGGIGGGLEGVASSTAARGEGGTQTKGGLSQANNGYPSGFGIGGQGNTGDYTYLIAGAGAGAGWYGGGGGWTATNAGYGGAGGSSYVQSSSTLLDLQITPTMLLYDGTTTAVGSNKFVDNPHIESGNGHARIRNVTGKAAVSANFEKSNNQTGVVQEINRDKDRKLAVTVDDGKSIELQFDIGDFSRIRDFDVNQTIVSPPDEMDTSNTDTITGIGKITLSRTKPETVMMKIEELQVNYVNITAMLQHTVEVLAEKESGWVTTPSQKFETFVDNGDTFDNSKLDSEGWQATHPDYAGFEITPTQIFGHTVFDVSDYVVDKELQPTPNIVYDVTEVPYATSGVLTSMSNLQAEGGQGTGKYIFEQVQQKSYDSLELLNSSTGSLMVVGVGSSQFRVMKEGDNLYNPSSWSDPFTITVNKGTQSKPVLKVSSSTVVYGETAPTLTPSGGSSDTKEWEYVQVSGTSMEVDSDGILKILGTGVSVFAVSRMGDDFYENSDLSDEVSITVQASEQSPPEFEKTVFELTYGENDNVLQLTAVDGNDGIGFEVQSGNASVDDGGLVSIESAGKIEIAAYKLATDTTEQSGDIILTLNVSKANQSSPEFDQTEFELEYGENDNKLQLTAVGGNEGIEFTLQSGDAEVDSNGLVTINDIGLIEISAYKIQTENYNQSDSVTITIQVVSSGLEAPEFEKTTFDVEYGENDNKLQLTAIGGNESIEYQVKSGDADVDADGLVSINSAGKIEIVAFRQATDTANQSVSTIITIHVAKISQDAPQFDKTTFNLVFGENGNQLQLQATGGNSGIVYQVQSGNATVDANGLVKINSAGLITITAYKSESTNHNQSSNTTITINVEQGEGTTNPPNPEKNDNLLSKQVIVVAGFGLGFIVFIALLLLTAKLKGNSKRK
jgi:hypothetical protein